MSMQNSLAEKWPGIAALVLGLAAAGALLRNADPAGMLNTWYLTRASGLVAYALLFGSVAVGLLQSLGMLRGVTLPAANVDVHEHLSLGALYATVFHATILLWDRYVPFALAEVLVPFVSDYETEEVALGVLSLYAMLLVTVSTYLRPRLQPRHWRMLHLVSLVAFLFALIHGVDMGSDSGHPAVAYFYRFSGISVGLLSAWRLVKGVRSRHADSARRG